MCTRIWWVRPVSSTQRSRLATGGLPKLLQHLVVGDGLAGRGGARHRHLLAVGGAAADGWRRWCPDCARHAPDDGQVGPLQPAVAAMGGELLGQALVCRVVLGDDQEAAGVLVEPVDDARPPHPADARQAVAAMGDQGIDQRSRLVAGTGVDDQACRLVDDDQVLVFIDNGRAPWSPPGVRPPRPGRITRHALRPASRLWRAFGDGHTLDSDLAFRDKALEARPADIRKGARQEAVEPVGGAAFGCRTVKGCGHETKSKLQQAVRSGDATPGTRALLRSGLYHGHRPGAAVPDALIGGIIWKATNGRQKPRGRRPCSLSALNLACAVRARNRDA